MNRKYREQRFYGWDKLLAVGTGARRFRRMVIRNADRSAWVAAWAYAKRHGIEVKLRFSTPPVAGVTGVLVVDRVA